MLPQTMSSSVRRAIERVAQVVAERDDALAIPRSTAEFLHALVLAGGFRRGVELGTSYGWSGLWIAAALQHNGGALTTVEADAEKAAFAREVFAKAGLGETITVLEGPIIDKLDEIYGPLDFVFIDADKPNSQRYFDRLWPKLSHRATIVTDNVTSHEQDLADYVDYLRRHPQLASVLVPIGSGLELSSKLDPYNATVTVDGADWVI